MTLTPERIAEIEADGMCTMEDETAELCRLARLGLVAEELCDQQRALFAMDPKQDQMARALAFSSLLARLERWIEPDNDAAAAVVEPAPTK